MDVREYQLEFVREFFKEFGEDNLNAEKCMFVLERLKLDNIYDIEFSTDFNFLYPKDMTNWLVIDLGYGSLSYYKDTKKKYSGNLLNEFDFMIEEIKTNKMLVVFINAGVFIQYSYVRGVTQTIERLKTILSLELDLCLTQVTPESQSRFLQITQEMKELEMIKVEQLKNYGEMIFAI